jgi:ComF family protein
LTAAKKFPAALLNLVFPDDCRVCGKPLSEVSRIPVCSPCLATPKPFVAEHFCISCGTPYLSDSPLLPDGRCRICRDGLAGFDAAFAYGEYDGPLRKLIHLFKYGRVKPLAKPLARLMAQALPREHRFDLIVPMPLHWTRRWDRGFNQAELLARALAKRLDAPVSRAIRRKRRTAPQAGLTNSERRANVSGAFALNTRISVRDRHVLLVDDIMTTGATAAACAALLKRAGAKRVSVLALARVDRRKSSVMSSPSDFSSTGSSVNA